MIDNVNKPKHYTRGKIECIDAIESAVEGLPGPEALLTGQALKYLWRWKWKNGTEDLRKAQWYLDRLLKHVLAEPRSREQTQAQSEERTHAPPVPNGVECEACSTCWHRPSDRPGTTYRVPSPLGAGVACKQCHKGNRWELPLESWGQGVECEGCAHRPTTPCSPEELWGSSCHTCRGGRNWKAATPTRRSEPRQS